MVQLLLDLVKAAKALGGGGTRQVQVRAHTRQTKNGPIQIPAHVRLVVSGAASAPASSSSRAPSTPAPTDHRQRLHRLRDEATKLRDQPETSPARRVELHNLVNELHPRDVNNPHHSDKTLENWANRSENKLQTMRGAPEKPSEKEKPPPEKKEPVSKQKGETLAGAAKRAGWDQTGTRAKRDEGRGVEKKAGESLTGAAERAGWGMGGNAEGAKRAGQQMADRIDRMDPPAEPAAPRTVEQMTEGARRVTMFQGTPKKQVAKKLKKALGIDATPADVVSWTGLGPDDVKGAVIEATFGGGPGGDGVSVVVNHPNYKMIRSYYRDYLGKLVARHDSFEIKGLPKGSGTRMFADQVQSLAKSGFEEIRTMAAGHGPRANEGKHWSQMDDDPQAIGDLNGYYTWPRLGYDGEIPRSKIAQLPESLRGATKLSDLMATKEGRDWWKDRGTDVTVDFDLKEGSLSRQMLARYLELKKGSGDDSGS